MFDSHDVIQSVKVGADAVSLGVVLATFAQWLPNLAALFTIIWTVIRIYETNTAQRVIAAIGRRLNA